MIQLDASTEQYNPSLSLKLLLRLRGFRSRKTPSELAREHTEVLEAYILENKTLVCIFNGKINRLYVSSLLNFGHFL